MLLTLIGTGCGPKNYLNDNDQLRRENMELARQIEALEVQLNQRLVQIESLREAAAGQPLPEGVDPPVVSGVEIDSYSGPIDTDRDGIDDVVRLYLLPTDQHGRMIPVAGTLTAALLEIPDEGEPRVLVEVSLNPEQLDAAYRDGFTGPYYLCELPVPADCPAEVTVRCVLKPFGAATVRAQEPYRVQITTVE